ncbi:hypothetical protein GOP47_0010648 [Adiantum capillus-veneris]|uniref:Uncharacterized protein n=1 Tax=Adiantum capillus-veneris TaxID=13818 RepID=A0A9D4UVQ1_ADICA|nr:hypothetical protein GOP47_0010648 [Adiantum capillus-veneris]
MDDESSSEEESGSEGEEEEASPQSSSYQHGSLTCPSKAPRVHASFEPKLGYCEEYTSDYETKVENVNQESFSESYINFLLEKEKSRVDQSNLKVEISDQDRNHKSYESYHQEERLTDNIPTVYNSQGSFESKLESGNTIEYHTVDSEKANNMCGESNLSLEQVKANKSISSVSHHSNQSKPYSPTSISTYMTLQSARRDFDVETSNFHDHRDFDVEQEESKKLGCKIDENYQPLPIFSLCSDT